MDGPFLHVMLTDLEQELASTGAVADLYMVGGAAMNLTGIRSDRITQDGDAAITSDTKAVLAASGRVAARHRMPPDDSAHAVAVGQDKTVIKMAPSRDSRYFDGRR